mgnify:CR=1 FL=1
MRDLDHRYPGFSLSGHKGYPTPSHVAALNALGPSPLHRRSFARCASARRSRSRSKNDDSTSAQRVRFDGHGVPRLRAELKLPCIGSDPRSPAPWVERPAHEVALRVVAAERPQHVPHAPGLRRPRRPPAAPGCARGRWSNARWSRSRRPSPCRAMNDRSIFSSCTGSFMMYDERRVAGAVVVDRQFDAEFARAGRATFCACAGSSMKPLSVISRHSRPGRHVVFGEQLRRRAPAVRGS